MCKNLDHLSFPLLGCNNLHQDLFIKSSEVGHCKFKCKRGSLFAFELPGSSNNRSGMSPLEGQVGRKKD